MGGEIKENLNNPLCGFRIDVESTSVVGKHE